MNVKHRIGLTTIAIAATLLSATACSSGSNASSGASGVQKAGNATAKTYTASELPKILTSAKNDLGVSGTVLGNSKVRAQISKYQSGSTLSKLLSSSKATISPAACSTLVKKGLTTTVPKAASVSSLTYGTSAVSVVAVPGKPLPSSFESRLTSTYDTLASAGCTSMKMNIAASGETVSMPITLAKKTVPTDADQTSAVEESITMPSFSGGSKSVITVLIVNAIKGNLAVTAQTYSGAGSSATSSTSPDAAEAVNAVIAAAKKS